MSYRERRTAVSGAVLWERVVRAGSERARILPDGCLDLIWDGRRLLVAGPDAAARWHVSSPGARYTALRFSGGAGPACLGVPADALLGRTIPLADLWPAREARTLADRVAVSPAAALEAWAAECCDTRPADPLGRPILAMSEAAWPVTVMAERLGLSTRQLHRRCLPIYGYGPRRLTRVLRLGRALDAARAGAPLARVAASCGYADQAHLCRETRELTGTTPTGLLGGRGLR